MAQDVNWRNGMASTSDIRNGLWRNSNNGSANPMLNSLPFRPSPPTGPFPSSQSTSGYVYNPNAPEFRFSTKDGPRNAYVPSVVLPNLESRGPVPVQIPRTQLPYQQLRTQWPLPPQVSNRQQPSLVSAQVPFSVGGGQQGRPSQQSITRSEESISSSSFAAGPSSQSSVKGRDSYTFQLPHREGYALRTRDYFTVGKVFEADVAELSDEATVTSVTGGSSYYMKPRYYIVIEQCIDHFTAIGLYSYGRAGVARKGIKSEHCIAYSNDKTTSLEPMQSERPGPNEAGMKPTPIRIERADMESAHLRDATRLNLGREFSPLDYTRLPVKHYGKVDWHSLQALICQWELVRAARSERTKESMKREQIRRDAKKEKRTR